MIKRLNPIHAAALAFLLAAGCAQPTALVVKPAAQVVTQGAALHLKLDLGRRTQVLASEVTGISVTVELPGQAPVTKLFTPTDLQNDALDFSGLPGGNATIVVRAYAQELQVGEGKALVPLLIGRRTLAQVHVGLSTDGKSEILPFGPMK